MTHLLGRPGLSSLGPSILHPPIVVCRVLKIFWSPPDKSGAGSLPRYPALQFSYWSRNSILSSSYTIEHVVLTYLLGRPGLLSLGPVYCKGGLWIVCRVLKFLLETPR